MKLTKQVKVPPPKNAYPLTRPDTNLDDPNEE